MKKLLLILLCILMSMNVCAQLDANSLMGLPTATDLAEITAIAGPQIGAAVFNSDDQEVYHYTSAGWQRNNTDDQLDTEVNLDTPIDVDEAGEASPSNETTVQEVIQAIAPITSKAARVFYPPSIEVDASVIATNLTVDLYAQYTAQFATPVAANPAAPGVIPVYTATELHYYVTYADPAVFANISIDNNGIMRYDVIATPTDFNTLINVVFVVK